MQIVPPSLPRDWPGRFVPLLLAVSLAGCYAPVHSVGIPARSLPDTFRMPQRTAGPQLNFAALTIPPQTDYLLGAGDTLEVTVHGLFPGVAASPFRVQVMGSGEIFLPVVGAIRVAGRNLMQAQQTITAAYADGILRDPRVNVFLVEKSSTSVLVLGEVRNPGAYRLSKYENDVAHALASAGGLTENAGLVIEIHRRVNAATPAGDPGFRLERLPPPDEPAPAADDAKSAPSSDAAMPFPLEPGWSMSPDLWSTGPFGYPNPNMEILRIPLRGFPEQPVSATDTVLQQGDVVVVPSRRHEVFFVVGRLSTNNAVRFSLGLAERELGGGFILPRDREIDVVTAVAMAGYIDPIDSPHTVTVHRVAPDGKPLLIRVNLLKARYDPRETVLVEPGDIIYLNPDVWWWSRTTFDRIIPSLFSLSYRKWLGLGGIGSDN